MPLHNPMLIEDSSRAIKRKLESLNSRWYNRWLIQLFVNRADATLKWPSVQANPSVVAEVGKVVDHVEESMPPLRRIESIDEDSLLELEAGARVLQDGIQGLNTILGAHSQNWEELENLKKAGQRDERDINRALKLKRARRASPEVRNSPLLLFDMDNPDADPRKIGPECKYLRYSEVIWRLVAEMSQQNSGEAFVPELWVRKERAHCFGDGRCWEYVGGTTPIDHSRTIDMVNVADRIDYIVATVRENEREIPIPIDVPRYGAGPCCGYGCRNVNEHLSRLWQFRRIEVARRISEPDAWNVLSTTLDTSVFPSRTNDLYIQCSRLSDMS